MSFSRFFVAFQSISVNYGVLAGGLSFLTPVGGKGLQISIGESIRISSGTATQLVKVTGILRVDTARYKVFLQQCISDAVFVKKYLLGGKAIKVYK